MKSSIELAEQGFIPDFLIRWGIRNLLRKRLREEGLKFVSVEKFADQLRDMPIAIETDLANEQHYELPPSYFHTVLGKRLKYSSTYWPSGDESLDQSEEIMLKLTAERAEISSGQRVLELGCGWGSFSLWAAENFPKSEFVGVSNSAPQRKFIESRAKERGINNLKIITANMVDFKPEGRFDRIVSIEMFEHMKNYEKLLKRISEWLNDEGKLFVHIFTHKELSYHFETDSDDDWMGKYFFTGGTMPGDDLLLQFQDDLKIDNHWLVNGAHYSKTLEAWLRKQDEKGSEIMTIFEETYGDKKQAKLWFNRWRIFYLACSELFKFRGGKEWMVSHYLFRKVG